MDQKRVTGTMVATAHCPNCVLWTLSQLNILVFVNVTLQQGDREATNPADNNTNIKATCSFYIDKDSSRHLTRDYYRKFVGTMKRDSPSDGGVAAEAQGERGGSQEVNV